MTVPILISLRRIVWQVASASSVPASARRRTDSTRVYARAGEQQAPLIGPPAMGAHPIGEEHHLLFHPVFHFATGAVPPVVQALRVADDVRHNEARIGAHFRVLGLRDHPADPPPGQRRVVEGGEEPLFLAGPLKFLLGLLHQRRVFCEQPTHCGPSRRCISPRGGRTTMSIRSRQKPLSARSTIFVRGHAARSRCTSSFRIAHAVFGRVDVAAAQIRHQQLVAAEDVQRQEAVAIVVAVEEPALLLPVHRSVRRIEVQDQVRRRLRLASG